MPNKTESEFLEEIVKDLEESGIERPDEYNRTFAWYKANQEEIKLKRACYKYVIVYNRRIALCTDDRAEADRFGDTHKNWIMIRERKIGKEEKIDYLPYL